MLRVGAAHLTTLIRWRRQAAWDQLIVRDHFERERRTDISMGRIGVDLLSALEHGNGWAGLDGEPRTMARVTTNPAMVASSGP